MTAIIGYGLLMIGLALLLSALIVTPVVWFVERVLKRRKAQ